jgi:hypothetical protein
VKRTRIAAFGLALALLVPTGSALAAEATTTTTVDVTVASSISISGIPATYSLGSSTGYGETLTGSTFSAVVTSNPAPFTFTAYPNADFARSGGGGTIAVNGRLAFIVDGGTAKFATGAGPTEAVTLASGTSGTGINVAMSLEVPTVAPGSYSTVVTWKVTN